MRVYDARDSNPERAVQTDRALALSELFKSLGDPTRVRILNALGKEERAVGDLADELAVSQSALSHQLRILRSQRLVTFRKDGKHSFYRLLDDNVLGVMEAAQLLRS